MARHALEWLSGVEGLAAHYDPGHAEYGWLVKRTGESAQRIPVKFRRGFPAEVRCTLADWCGGTCGRCGGEAWLDGVSGLRTPCPACSGTGRTPGHGPALVRAAPVERVAVADKRPLAAAGDFGWVLRRDGMYDEPHFLPREPWDGLRWYFPAPSARVYARCYPTEAADNEALSAALLALAWEG
jgi:hypothetical protein